MPQCSGDQAGLVSEDDELGAVAGVEFGHGAADVGACGGGADEQPLGDLVVAQALTDQ
jgi:hypothetical protein